MKFICTRESLMNEISLAEKISGKNLTLSVLNNILLTAKDGVITARATNLDIGIEISIPAKIEEDGVVAVPGDILHNTISNINDNNIEFKTENNNLLLITPSSRTIIKTHPTDDFPTIPRPKTKQSFNIKVKDLLSGILSVSHSASQSTIKPELSSVYITSNGEKLIFVSTDSFRLAEKTIPINSKIDFEQILLPIKNVQNIIRVLERFNSDVQIDVSDNQISFIFDKIFLISRLIDGTYPDYKQIIPKNHTTEIILLKHDLQNALKKAGIFSDKFNQVRFNIKPSKKSFSIYSKNADIGETNDKIDAAVSGDDIDISFNLKYITDSLQSINSDSISLTFNGLSKPIIVRGVSDNSFLYLVMPMNK